MGHTLLKPGEQVGGAVTSALGQSHVQSQSCPSSGQSQLHPHFRASTSGTVVMLSVVSSTVSVLVVVVTSSVVCGSVTIVPGHSTVPAIFRPLPFLILKLSTKLQPFSPLSLTWFTVATLFFGLQLIEDSSGLRASCVCSRVKVHLKLVEPILTTSLWMVVFACSLNV